MWDVLIIRPILNLLLLLYKYLGNETIIAVALVTLVLRLIVTPLMLKQQRAARKQQELRPKLLEIQKKYKDDPQKLMEEQRKLGINPLGGCLPSLIQLPLMIGLYQAIIRALASTPLQLLELPKDIYRWIPSFSSLIPLKSQFLWLDLALPDPLFILPILVVATSWFYQKLITPPALDAQAEAMNKQMTLMMPLMMGFFSLTYASGLAIYFLISNLVGILQYYLFRRHYAYPASETSGKKPAPQKQPRASAKS
ncbi:MAG: YidC/Oxa1 family membrane protein insertase [Anaerolineae bacterium]|jgi:YidC/Oxa1 family membrane protein insertase